VSRDWLPLADGESVAWEDGPRRTTALPGIAVGVGLAVAGVGLAAVGFGLVSVGVDFVAVSVSGTVGNTFLLAAPVVLAGVSIAAGAYLSVVNTEYVVTDRAVYEKTGVVGITVTEAPLSKVENSAFSQSSLGTVFGYGTVTIETAGGNDVSFRRIDDPQTARRLVDRASGDVIPGSLTQWRGVRDEVRALRRAVESR